MSLPSILYKYRTWDLEKPTNPDKHNHKILTARELYFASPRDFNDPFDCNIEFCFNNSSDDEIIRYLRDKHSVAEVNDFKRRLSLDRAGTLQEIPTKRQSLIAQTGVLCLSADPKHLLMWSHYADSHKGFCLGIDSRYLLGLEDNCPGNLILDNLQVEYTNQLPKPNPICSNDGDWFKQQYRYKSEVWSYEQESRFIMIGEDDLTPDNRIIELPPKAIREVILGCCMDNPAKRDTTRTVDLLRRKNPDIQLLRAQRSRNHFELEIVPA